MLERLAGAKEPMTHAELVDGLASAGLDRATVFRNLRDLTEAGLVTRVDLGDRVWRFQVKEVAGAHGHPHFVCTECGGIECLDGLEITVPKRRGLPRALRNDKVTIHVKGRCDNCDH